MRVRLGIGQTALACAALISGCSVGPKYARPAAVPPSATIPAAYKETPLPPEGWVPAAPQDEMLRGKWWSIFDDATLNDLEDKVTVNNQNLAQQEANYRAATEQVRVARSYLFPTLTAGPQAQREKESQHRPFVSGSVPGYPTPEFTENDFLLSGNFSYEIDAWGRVRHTVEQARAQAQASAADLATLNLSLHAQLATDYFQLRGQDLQIALLHDAVQQYQKALELTENRYVGGIVSGLDVAQARTQLETARSQETDAEQQRAVLQHAIATLTGQNASTFSIGAIVLRGEPPYVPAGMPSELVERRPDVASAERQVKAANENIGIQRAAYFPTIQLIADGGFESTQLGNLIQGPSSLWALGASAMETLFDAGRRKALNAQARDQYDAEVAGYRQTTLTAFQQVEDSLASERVLQQEEQTQDEAVQSARRYLDLAFNRYKGGVSTYLDVTTAQTALLTAQRSEADVLTRKFVATVSLVQALGGGWERGKDLPGGN